MRCLHHSWPLPPIFELFIGVPGSCSARVIELCVFRIQDESDSDHVIMAMHQIARKTARVGGLFIR